jgi:hypothetical protein
MAGCKYNLNDPKEKARRPGAIRSTRLFSLRLLIPISCLSKIFPAASRGDQQGASRVAWAVWAVWLLAAEEAVL